MGNTLSANSAFRSWVPNLHSFPRQLVFLTPIDSDLHTFLKDCHALALHNPEIVARIYADLDIHGKRKKLQRLEDADFIQAQTPWLSGTPFPSQSRKLDDLTLEIGRPRTDAYVAFLFLMLRGLCGGCKDQQATLLLMESCTLRYWLDPLGIPFPQPSTLSEILNAISNDTRTFIHKAQLNKFLGEGLDDYDWVFVDSTCSAANSDRPTDSNLMVKLIRRILSIGGKLHRLSLPDMNMCGLWEQHKELQRLNQQILFLNGKSRSASKRKILYYQIIRRVRRLSKRLSRELEVVLGIFSELSELLPSRRSMAQSALDGIGNDIATLLQVAETAERRVLNLEEVAVGEKVISISDKDASFIVKGGWNTVVGYRPQLARSGSGFVTGMHVPIGNAADSPQLVSMVREHINNTNVVPTVVSADDGYSSREGRETLRADGVKVVSISGAKGKKVTDEREWKSPAYRKARTERSAMESLMFTLKFNHDFGRMARREREKVLAEMLEKVVAYNFCQASRVRNRKAKAAESKAPE